MKQSANNALELATIALTHIHVDPDQPRKTYSQESIRELADNILAVGLIQPIVVRRGQEGDYYISAGERRYRSCLLAGLDEVPCIICNSEMTDHVAFVRQMSENIHREDLNPFEVAAGVKRYREEFGATFEDIAKVHGGDTTKWHRYNKLNRASDELKALVSGGVLRSVVVLGELIELAEIDPDVYQTTLECIQEGRYKGTLERFVKNNRQRAKAKDVLGYLPPVADEAGLYDDSFPHVRRTRIEGERGGYIEFLSLQIARNSWVAGYRVNCGGEITAPISVTNKGKTEDEVLSLVADQIIIYLRGLQARVAKSQYAHDSLVLLNKVLTWCAKHNGEIENTKHRAQERKANSGVGVQAKDIKREDTDIVIAVKGQTLRISIEDIRALL